MPSMYPKDANNRGTEHVGTLKTLQSHLDDGVVRGSKESGVGRLGISYHGGTSCRISESSSGVLSHIRRLWIECRFEVGIGFTCTFYNSHSAIS